MSAKSDEYRRKAEEAEQSAKTVRDLSAKRTYEKVAEDYRFLAEQQERIDRF